MARTKAVARKRDNDNEVWSSKKIKSNASSPSMLEYGQQLLTQGTFSDITVVTKHKEYQLHRVLLARSSYFSTLFKGPWCDSTKNMNLSHVEEAIPGEITVGVWDALFHYLYTAKIDVSGMNLKDVKALVHLVKFFDLPTEVIVEALSPLGKLYILDVLDELDELDTSIEMAKGRLLSFICHFDHVQNIVIHNTNDWQGATISSMMEQLSYVSDSFVTKLINMKSIPLDTKVALLYLWIKQRLNTDPKQDIAWRQLDAATEYVKLVDSLNLHVMQDIQAFKALNIFSDEAFKEALQWKAGPADNFGPHSVFRWQTFNAEADSMETIELVKGINIDVECGERSCAWWWVISPHNHTSHTLKITLQISGIFSGGYPSECTTHTEVLEPGEKKEDITTYYGRQFDQNGVVVYVVATIEREE